MGLVKVKIDFNLKKGQSINFFTGSNYTYQQLGCAG